jgi:DinB family
VSSVSGLLPLSCNSRVALFRHDDRGKIGSARYDVPLQDVRCLQCLCNERLYDAVAQVSDADYRADRGAFFKSLHGTLNHLLVGDRIWMQRFTSQGEAPLTLDAILFDDFAQLRAVRRAEDSASAATLAA